MKLIPDSNLSRVPLFLMSWSIKVILPESIAWIPIIASTTSFWPLPSTPAIPKISDLFTSNDMSVNIFLPSSSWDFKFSTFKIATSLVDVALGGGTGRLLPIIISANWILLTLLFKTVSIICPDLITDISSAISKTSSNLCEINNTVTPLSFRSFKFLNNSSTSWGTNTAVGSSKINIFAPLYKTLIISTLCFSPTLSSSTYWSRSILSEYRFITFWISDLYLANLIFFKNGLSIPKIIFSKTVRFFANIKCWWTIPIPKFIASLGEEMFALFSKISMIPESGFTIPYNIFIKVDLPAPFSPTIACICPE